VNNLEVDRLIKELHALVIEQRRIADAMEGVIRSGSPFIDPNDDQPVTVRNEVDD
jgi:hypothetical protein